MIPLATLPPDAVVVRGGACRDPNTLIGSVQYALERSGKPVLSVYIVSLDPDEGEDASVLTACVDGPVVHNQVQVSSVEKLLDAGFTIADERAPDESYCHYHVYFSEPVQESEAVAWMTVFEAPIPNPAKKRKEAL